MVVGSARLILLLKQDDSKFPKNAKLKNIVFRNNCKTEQKTKKDLAILLVNLNQKASL